MSIFVRDSRELTIQALEKEIVEKEISFTEKRWIKRLLNTGLPYSVSKRIVKRIPIDDVLILIRKPYRYLPEIKGFTLEYADIVGRSTPIDDPERLMYATLYALEEACDSGSHMYAEPWRVKRELKRIAENSRPFPGDFNIYEQIDILVAADMVKNVRTKSGKQLWYPKLNHAYEDVVATVIKNNVNILEKDRYTSLFFQPHINDGEVDAVTTNIEGAIGFNLSNEQRGAVNSLAQTGIGILTGLPGTGKSTVSRLLVEHAKYHGLDPLLLAPTGIAARRLSSVCVHPAHTCHRAIYSQLARPTDGPFNKRKFIIIDEVSMLDQQTMAQIIVLASKWSPQLILVGDDNQLPSVGPGEVLFQLIKSGVIPTHRLTRIFRSDGVINSNAHLINDGMFPVEKDSEFEIIPDGSMETISELYLPDTTQILSPSWKGPLGVHAINDFVRTAANEWQHPYTGKWFGVGDKILITQNDYEVGVVNGDQGELTYLGGDKFDICLSDGRNIIVDNEFMTESVVHGYCATIHKSQGMEYDRVILVWPGQKWSMFRELFYTAITRAKKSVYIIGNPQDVEMAIRSSRRGKRNSLLWRKMQIA